MVNLKNLKKIPPQFHKDIQLFINTCLEVLDGDVVSIILFGSIAKVTYKELSDLDFCVVVKRYPERDWEVGGRIKYLCLQGGSSCPVQPVFWEERDLNIPSPFLYEVAQNGILIFGENILPMIKEICRDVKPLMKGKLRIGWQVV